MENSSESQNAASQYMKDIDQRLSVVPWGLLAAVSGVIALVGAIFYLFGVHSDGRFIVFCTNFATPAWVLAVVSMLVKDVTRKFAVWGAAAYVLVVIVNAIAQQAHWSSSL